MKTEEVRQKILDKLFSDECTEELERLKSEFIPTVKEKPNE